MQPHQDQIHATTRIESGENDMEGHYNGQRLKVDGHDDAVIEFNIVGSYNGPGMPIFVYEYVEI